MLSRAIDFFNDEVYELRDGELHPDRRAHRRHGVGCIATGC